MNNLDTLLNDSGIKVFKKEEEYAELSEKFKLPISEIRFIDLNRTGVYLPNQEVRVGFRARFLTSIKTLEARKTYFALPVRSNSDSGFSVSNGKLMLSDTEFGKTEKVELDTCDTSYMRGPDKLNLNSRRRGNCGGCDACVHNYKDLYDETVLKDNESLETEEQILTFFNNLEAKGVNISELKQIAVVTGLFHGENNVLEHMAKIKEIVEPKGFNGELMYFGCEVNSKSALRKLRELGDFSLIYAVDNFTKREDILNRKKAAITLEKARETLANAKEIGLKTTYAYIVGIDSLEIMSEETEKFLPYITKFPIINIYQIQTLGQAKAMEEEARNLDYYLKSRELFEEIFRKTEFKPTRWENYRPLWYDLYLGKEF